MDGAHARRSTPWIDLLWSLNRLQRGAAREGYRHLSSEVEKHVGQAPNAEGEALPDRQQVQRDFAHIRQLGGNSIRVYYPPPLWILDEACAHGLRVFIDVPWEKHRCFFEDWEALERARQLVTLTARRLGSHPGVFAISIANEIPVDDGSTDETRSIADDYPQVAYYHRESRGLSGAHNVGARLATGEIVAYTNSD
jgi:hypothetical protein